MLYKVKFLLLNLMCLLPLFRAWRAEHAEDDPYGDEVWGDSSTFDRQWK